MPRISVASSGKPGQPRRGQEKQDEAPYSRVDILMQHYGPWPGWNMLRKKWRIFQAVLLMVGFNVLRVACAATSPGLPLSVEKELDLQTHGAAALAVLRVADGTLVKAVNSPQPESHDRRLTRAQYFMTSPDQTILALATTAGGNYPGLEKNVAVYDTRSWQALTTARVDSIVGSLCLFANGADLGLGTYDRTLTILNAKSGAPVTDIRAYEKSQYVNVAIGAIAGDPKGELILAGAGSIVLLGPYNRSPEQLAWVDSVETVKMFRVKDGA